MDEDGELLKLMEDESVLVMGIFRSISISDETVVDINVELADSGEGADVLKLRLFPLFFHEDAHRTSAFRRCDRTSRSYRVLK